MITEKCFLKPSTFYQDYQMEKPNVAYEHSIIRCNTQLIKMLSDRSRGENM